MDENRLSYPLEERNENDSQELDIKFLDSRKIRKKAEEDAQLLANRIALLELEEKKALKKIEETRKKAKEILQNKIRNQEIQKQREEMKRKQEEERLQKINQTNLIKEQARQNKENLRKQHMEKIKQEAEIVKKINKETKQLVLCNKEEDYTKNATIVNKIKEVEKEVGMKKKKIVNEKMQQAKRSYEEKIRKELIMKDQTEMLISKLEQKEMELIERLQNTQSLQKSAFEDLEKALQS